MQRACASAPAWGVCFEGSCVAALFIQVTSSARGVQRHVIRGHSQPQADRSRRFGPDNAGNFLGDQRSPVALGLSRKASADADLTKIVS